MFRNRDPLELALDNEDSEHENDEDTNQSEFNRLVYSMHSDRYLLHRSVVIMLGLIKQIFVEIFLDKYFFCILAHKLPSR